MEIRAEAEAHLEETAARAQQIQHLRRANDLMRAQEKRIRSGEIPDDDDSAEARELNALIDALWVELDEYPHPFRT